MGAANMTLPPQNNIPPDMDALLAWLKEQVLEANTKAYNEGYCKDDHETGKYHLGEQHALECVIAKIENSRVSQRPHVSQPPPSRGFYIPITRCYDCPYKEYGVRKCGDVDRWFDDFEIETGIPDWCPKNPQGILAGWDEV